MLRVQVTVQCVHGSVKHAHWRKPTASKGERECTCRPIEVLSAHDLVR